MSDASDRAYRRRPQLSAHNWHSWSIPPAARVPFDFSAQHAGQPPTEEAPPVRTAAESMVAVLCELGMDTFFGIPGGPVIPIFDAILTNPAARLVESRHEAYAAFAAMGYYRASGRIPVVVVTAGPGATNVVTGIVSAHLERVPMVVICGDVPWTAVGRRVFQDTGESGVGIERMLRGVTRSVVRIVQAASAGCQLRAAVAAAVRQEDPGPSLVVISIDTAGSKTAAPEIHSALAPEASPRAPDPMLLQRIAGRLQGARRPLIMIGAGCRGAVRQVRTLVEAAGVPFVTTPQAKGTLPEDHPLSLRTCGVGCSLWARRYMTPPPDVTLVLGTDLDDMVTTGTAPTGPGGYLVHVDRDASVIGRNVPTAIAAVYEVAPFAEALAATMSDSGLRWHGAALVRDVRGVAPFDVAEFTDDAALPLAPHRAIADLERAAGPDATFVTDIGEHTLFALHYLTIRERRRFVVHLGLGSMGSGISSTVGLALGDPGRRVICVCGDGGMQMAGMEILVAIKMRLPVIYAVFNDARYNMVYHGYRLTFGREAMWETPMIDFAGWARSLGARSHLVTRPGEITGELLATLTEGGSPAVLDIRHDANQRIRGSGRAEAVRESMRSANT